VLLLSTATGEGIIPTSPLHHDHGNTGILSSSYQHPISRIPEEWQLISDDTHHNDHDDNDWSRLGMDINIVLYLVLVILLLVLVILLLVHVILVFVPGHPIISPSHPIISPCHLLVIL
jgi:hypothetical protein